mmetsp:Transcript_20202/g.45745  ORF Transcript_20202/g.45745 Transcript_20202/m.45745 type:complete len:208 (+) Transcript_20202:282-905(+)
MGFGWADQTRFRWDRGLAPNEWISRAKKPLWIARRIGAEAELGVAALPLALRSNHGVEPGLRLVVGVLVGHQGAHDGRALLREPWRPLTLARPDAASPRVVLPETAARHLVWARCAGGARPRWVPRQLAKTPLTSDLLGPTLTSRKRFRGAIIDQGRGLVAWSFTPRTRATVMAADRHHVRKFVRHAVLVRPALAKLLAACVEHCAV